MRLIYSPLRLLAFVSILPEPAASGQIADKINGIITTDRNFIFHVLGNISANLQIMNLHVLCDLDQCFGKDFLSSYTFVAKTISTTGERFRIPRVAGESILLLESSQSKIITVLGALRGMYFDGMIIVLRGACGSAYEVQRPEMDELFAACWKSGFLNVVVIPWCARDQESVQVFSYSPFSEGKCFDTSARIIQILDRKNISSKSRGLLPREKLRNLQGCRLDVVTSAAYVHSLRRKHVVYPEPNVVLLDWLAKGLNFVPVLRLSNQHDVEQDIVDGNADMGFGVMRRVEMDKPFDGPMSSATECYTLCLPENYIPLSSFHLAYGEFESPVWIGLAIACLATATTMELLKYFEINRIERFLTSQLLSIFGSLMTVIKPVLWSYRSRSIFTIWTFSCLVMTALYSAQLISLATAPAKTRFQSMEEVIESDIPIHAQTQWRDVFKNYTWYPGFSKRVTHFGNKKVFTTFAMSMPHRNTSWFIPQGTCIVHDHWYVIPGECFATYNVYFFLLPRGSALKWPLSSMTRYAEQGMAYHWDPPKRFYRKRNTSVAREGLQAYLKVLLWGWGLAFFVFLAELACKTKQKFCTDEP